MLYLVFFMYWITGQPQNFDKRAKETLGIWIIEIRRKSVITLER